MGLLTSPINSLTECQEQLRKDAGQTPERPVGDLCGAGGSRRVTLIFKILELRGHSTCGGYDLMKRHGFFYLKNNKSMALGNVIKIKIIKPVKNLQYQVNLRHSVSSVDVWNQSEI